MGNIRKYTLRFDMDDPFEAQAASYLQELSKCRGISKNAALIQLLTADMERNRDQDGVKEQTGETERMIEKLVSGVLQGIRKEGLLAQSIAERPSEVLELPSLEDCGEELLSDDSMAFLDAFEA